jgi:hypothetical protein
VPSVDVSAVPTRWSDRSTSTASSVCSPCLRRCRKSRRQQERERQAPARRAADGHFLPAVTEHRRRLTVHAEHHENATALPLATTS